MLSDFMLLKMAELIPDANVHLNLDKFISHCHNVKLKSLI